MTAAAFEKIFSSPKKRQPEIVTDFLHSGPGPFSKAPLCPILNSSINEESSLASNAILLSAHDRSIKAPKSVPAPPFSRTSLTYVLPYVARHSARQKTRTTLSRFFLFVYWACCSAFFLQPNGGFAGVQDAFRLRTPISVASSEYRLIVTGVLRGAPAHRSCA